jgi:excisionase family DNA binding protein
MASDFTLLTSSQAAQLLEVHESSVKRWTNEGALKPARTPGGHRRIPLPELLQFARAQRTEAALLRFSPFEQEMGRAALAARERNDFDPLASLIVKLVDTQPPGYLVRALLFLERACGVPLARSFDLGVGEAMRRVGGQWEKGLRTIAHEHRFTQKIMDSLYALRPPEADEPKPDVPLALVGCADSCFHEIGAMFARLALESAGWRVIYLGGNVPFGEFAGLQAELDARLVAISFVPPTGNADAQRGVSILAGGYRPERPYWLALGGGGLKPDLLDLKRTPFLGASAHRNIEALQDWARSKLRTEIARARPAPVPGIGAAVKS